MKNCILILVFILFFVNSNADLSVGIISYYPFNGNPIDESLNGNDGNVSGALLTTDRFSDPDKAYLFDGNDDSIEVDDKLDLRISNADFTLSAWVYETARNSSYQDAIMVKRGPDEEDGWFFSITGNAGSFGAGRLLYQVSGGIDPVALSSALIPLFTWTHVLVVYNNSANMIEMYIDGEYDSTTFDVPSPFSDTQENLFIGKDSAGAFNFYNFHGKIDDILIYNRGLSLEEIGLLFQGENPLSIELSSFTAVFSNGNSILNWTTLSETDNFGWNIYRSETNNIIESILLNGDLISGAGTTFEPTDYSFIDENFLIENTTYNYWLESVEYSGNTEFFGPISINIEYQPDNPTPPTTITTGLHQNYPNPFNPETEIIFAIDKPGNAELAIYNIKGQEIISLFNDQVNANEYIKVKWNGKDQNQNKVSSGVYMYKLRTANYEFIKKMILMK